MKIFYVIFLKKIIDKNLASMSKTKFNFIYF